MQETRHCRPCACADYAGKAKDPARTRRNSGPLSGLNHLCRSPDGQQEGRQSKELISEESEAHIGRREERGTAEDAFRRRG